MVSKAEVSRYFSVKRFCVCGCGVEIKQENRYYKSIPKILKGHYQRLDSFKPHTPYGINHWNWLGDNVGNAQLHIWVRQHFPSTELCQDCNKKPPHDLANVTGIYNRDFSNWKYLCRKCHMILDNFFEKCKATQFKKGKRLPEFEEKRLAGFMDVRGIPEDRHCYKCGSFKTAGRRWYKFGIEGEYLCQTCYNHSRAYYKRF